MHNLKRRKILFIDHESGHGGSSISLYNKIKLFSKKDSNISIILKKKSYLVKKYKNLNVKVYYLEIPTITSLRKLRSNIISYIKFFFKFLIFNFKNKEFYSFINQFDYVHLNHENLFWLLKFIKSYNKNIKISINIRTILIKNFFSKIQTNIINTNANRKLFISKKNLIEFNNQVENKKNNNFILENFDLNKQPTNHFIKLKSKRLKLKVLSISNHSFDRGVDRIINIAQKLNCKDFKNIEFNIVGDYRIKSVKNLFKKRESYDLKYLAKKKKIKNLKIWGHRSNPIKFFKNNHLLLYLPRNDSAWGRNLIEALNNGLPVITVGKTNLLIIDKKNGHFNKKFDEKKIINIIKKFYFNRKALLQMSFNAKNISNINNKKKRIKRILNNFFEY